MVCEMIMNRKKDELIPLARSRRVIHLEKRGRKKKISLGSVLFNIVGIACLLYCLAILFCGFGTYFFLIWGVLGAVCIAVGRLLTYEGWTEVIPAWARYTVGGLAGAAFLLFIVVEGMILSGFGETASPHADYVIVLGAQWKTNGPSEVLRRRLDRAAAYLEENPQSMVIVSGGRGSNEPISEAEGMKSYLMQAGIAEERIQTEDQSLNTMENLRNSSRLLEKAQDEVVVVTNDFHMFRALKIAEKQGYEHVTGLTASSVPGFLPNNLLREFFSVIKNFVAGNM